MIHEYKGLTPSLQDRTLDSNCKSIPFSQWSFDANFTGEHFLDEILERRATVLPDAQPFLNLHRSILDAWASYWKFGYSPMINDSNRVAWMKFGDYHLCFNFKGAKLTVRKGNRYGWIVDAHDCAEWDWPSFLEGCESVLGIPGLPLPESIGKIAGALLPEQRAHQAALKLKTPWPAALLAWRAYKGSRMEALSLGTFKGVGLDISSAFPYSASQCPMIYPCIWEDSLIYQPHAIYGFAEIDVEIPDGLKAAPLAIRIKPENETELTFPTGKIRCTVSMPEMRLLNDMGIPFRIRQGFWGYPQTEYLPFKDIMEKLWILRQYDPAAAKALSVAVVGQMGSVHVTSNTRCEARGGWNPVYAAHILADVRCRIYRQALAVGMENVKAFTVDGLIVSGGSRTSLPTFGDWRMESKGTFLIANDYFKDRPGSTFIKECVEFAQQDGRFEMPEDFYFDLQYALTNDCPENAGQSTQKSVDLPLGSIYRKMPEGLTREDFLTREIGTWL